jgi:hypothetical protein
MLSLLGSIQNFLNQRGSRISSFDGNTPLFGSCEFASNEELLQNYKRIRFFWCFGFCIYVFFVE